MDVSELRKRIIRALDEARKDATTRRQHVDEAQAAYERFLGGVAVPTMKHAATVLKAQGFPCTVDTPAESVRLTMAGSHDTFVELALDTRAPAPHVVGRTSVGRGRSGLMVDETPLANGKAVGELTDEDVAAYLVSAIPKLVLRS
jgi:hypothetical protein